MTFGERYRASQVKTGAVLAQISEAIQSQGIGANRSEIKETATSGQRLTFMAADGRTYSLTLRCQDALHAEEAAA